MKYSLIKWLGTVIIVVLSVFIAMKLTFRGKILEEKFYKLNLPEYSFVLRDGRQLRIVLGLGFKTDETVKEVSGKQKELQECLKTMFKNVESDAFESSLNMLEIKTKILLELNRAGFSVEYVTFDVYPRIY